MICIGLMSGTSADGIEAAASQIHLDGPELLMRPLGHQSLPFPPGLREEIEAALPPAATGADTVCRLDTCIGQAFAEAAASATEELCDGRADVVVSHGQTLYHWVEQGSVRGTLQLGEPAWVAERTGLPVVSNLRSRDVAAGGQGAPLVSRFDCLMLGASEKPRAALNLGGIANLTVVSPETPPLAFDTGPANALIDAAVVHFTGGEERMDTGGVLARRGRVVPELLEHLLCDPYYRQKPPKSTGKEHFNLPYLLGILEHLPPLEPDDVVATVTALTAETVARECRRYGVTEVTASGGGMENSALVRMLEERLPQTRLGSTDEWGVPSQAKEAYAFGILGFLALHGLPGNVPSCTGAWQPAVLGDITPGAGPLRPSEPPAVQPSRLRLVLEAGSRAATGGSVLWDAPGNPE